MNYPLVRESIAPGVYFSSITDKKFKHNRMSVNPVSYTHLDPTDYEYVKTSILHALKDEAFEEYLLQQAQDESYELNQKAADRYQINKLELS